MAKKCARTFSIVVEKGKKSILDVTHLLPDALPRSVARMQQTARAYVQLTERRAASVSLRRPQRKATLAADTTHELLGRPPTYPHLRENCPRVRGEKCVLGYTPGKGMQPRASRGAVVQRRSEISDELPLDLSSD